MGKGAVSGCNHRDEGNEQIGLSLSSADPFCETQRFLILPYAQKAKALLAPALAEPFQL